MAGQRFDQALTHLSPAVDQRFELGSVLGGRLGGAASRRCLVAPLRLQPTHRSCVSCYPFLFSAVLLTPALLLSLDRSVLPLDSCPELPVLLTC